MRALVVDDELAVLLEQEQPLDQAARDSFARRAAELDVAYFQMTKEDWETEKATLETWPKS